MKRLARTDHHPDSSDAAAREGGEAHARRLPADRFQPLGADGAGDLKPIGPERLRELREKIRNGTYPTSQHVEEGLLRMFLRPHASRPDDTP